MSQIPILILFLFIAAHFNGIDGATASVNLAGIRQTIQGFGASSAWQGAVSDNAMNSLFGNGNNNQIGLSIIRLRIDPGKNWAEETVNAQKAVARGAKVMASPWTAPASMKTNYNVVGGSLRLDQYQAYADYLQSFVQHLQSNGVQLYAISVQNEPDIHVSYESMEWTPQQMVDFLRSQGSRISGTKLMAAESFQFRKDITDAILNDATAASKVSIIAGHIYGGGLGNYVLAKQKGKDVWMTEHYLDGDSWQMCMQTAKEIHDSMTMAEYNAYLTWWFKDANPNDQDRSIGPIDGNGNPTILGYVLGQWAKFVRPNSVRIDATPNPSSNVFVSAYKSENQVVIVAVNMGGWTSQQFSISGGSVPSSFTPFVTSNNKRISTEATVSVSGGSFTFNLEAQSVTTFVSSGTDQPNPNPDPNPNPNPNPATTKATTKQPGGGGGGGGGSASATASVMVGSTWNGGGQFRVVIKNTGSKPLCKVVFKLSLASGQTINSIWNADAQSAGQYSTPGWVNIAVGATSQDTGFVVSGSSATPTVSVLSANAC